MSVERNTITCDSDHEEPVTLVVPEVSPTFVTPPSVRVYAHEHGRTMRRGQDYCAACLATMKVDEKGNQPMIMMEHWLIRLPSNDEWDEAWEENNPGSKWMDHVEKIVERSVDSSWWLSAPGWLREESQRVTKTLDWGATMYEVTPEEAGRLWTEPVLSHA
jgi:hypothetical protein